MNARDSIKNFNYPKFASDVSLYGPSGYYLGQKYIAEKTGISQSTLSRIVTQHSSSLKVSQFLKLCEFCELDPHDYL